MAVPCWGHPDDFGGGFRRRVSQNEKADGGKPLNENMIKKAVRFRTAFFVRAVRVFLPVFGKIYRGGLIDRSFNSSYNKKSEMKRGDADENGCV